MLQHFFLTVTMLLLLLQYPIPSCPSPLGEFFHPYRGKLRQLRGLSKGGSLEQRGLRLEGAVAATWGVSILTLTSGTSALGHAGLGGASPKVTLGGSGCWVGIYPARNPPQEGKLITRSAPGLMFGSRST